VCSSSPVGEAKARVQRLLDDVNGAYATQIGAVKLEKSRHTQFPVNDLICRINLAYVMSTRTNPVIYELQMNTFVYSHVLFKRICDDIPLIIRYHLINQLQPTINDNCNVLLSTIQTTSNSKDGGEKLLQMMREQQELHVKRERLMASIAKLEEAFKVSNTYTYTYSQTHMYSMQMDTGNNVHILQLRRS